MALIACPECKKKISETAGNCPKCGYQLTAAKVAEIKKKEQRTRNARAIGCLSIIAISFVLGVIDSFFSSDSPSSSKSTTSSPSEVVKNSAWDGSVWQVESWLKANLKDPDSLEFIEWSPVQKTRDGGFMVRAKYRAKNSFGGYVVENRLFFMDSAGNVITTMTIDF
ncbi:MAG: hypothetical protein ACOY7U_08580 [Acidobacteriota bacterium]|jgi:hypothetical protein